MSTAPLPVLSAGPSSGPPLSPIDAVLAALDSIDVIHVAAGVAAVLAVLLMSVSVVWCRVRRAVGAHARLPAVASIRSAKAPHLIVCAGDGLTHGAFSHDWVATLNLPGCRVANEGYHGHTAAHLLARLPQVLKHEPHVLYVMVGTCDVVESFAPGADVVAKKEEFGANVAAIIATVDAHNEKVVAASRTGTHLRLLTLPPLSSSAANVRVQEYNNVIRTAAADCQADIVIDVYDRLVAALQTQPAAAAAPAREFSYAEYARRARQSSRARFAWGRSWSAQSRAANLPLHLPDGVHLNEHGGRVIRELVQQDAVATTAAPADGTPTPPPPRYIPLPPPSPLPSSPSVERRVSQPTSDMLQAVIQQRKSVSQTTKSNRISVTSPVGVLTEGMAQRRAQLTKYDD